VFHDQGGYRNGFANGLCRNAPIPLTCDLIPRKPLFELFQNQPHHNACAFERRLTAANLGVRDDVPPQLNAKPLVSRFHFHAYASHYALLPPRLQASAGPAFATKDLKGHKGGKPVFGFGIPISSLGTLPSFVAIAPPSALFVFSAVNP